MKVVVFGFLLLAVSTVVCAQGDWVRFDSKGKGQGGEYYRKSSVERLGNKVKVDIKAEGGALLKQNVQNVVVTVVYDCKNMTVRELSERYTGTDGKVTRLPVDGREMEVFSNATYKAAASILCRSK